MLRARDTADAAVRALCLRGMCGQDCREERVPPAARDRCVGLSVLPAADPYEACKSVTVVSGLEVLRLEARKGKFVRTREDDWVEDVSSLSQLESSDFHPTARKGEFSCSLDLRACLPGVSLVSQKAGEEPKRRSKKRKAQRTSGSPSVATAEQVACPAPSTQQPQQQYVQYAQPGQHGKY